MYAQVALTLPMPHRVVEIPATAVLNDAKGTRVAIVTPEGRLHFVNIGLERDNGATVDVAIGLTGTERVVKVASADMVEGQEVQEVEGATPAP
jgi:hypothetical protein